MFDTSTAREYAANDRTRSKEKTTRFITELCDVIDRLQTAPAEAPPADNSHPTGPFMTFCNGPHTWVVDAKQRLWLIEGATMRPVTVFVDNQPKPFGQVEWNKGEPLPDSITSGSATAYANIDHALSDRAQALADAKARDAEAQGMMIEDKQTGEVRYLPPAFNDPAPLQATKDIEAAHGEDWVHDGPVADDGGAH